MKTAVSILALAALLSGLTISGAVAQKGKKAPAKPAYPQTFACKHCKIKMTVKTAADMKKTCWVCKCKKAAKDCK